MNINQACKALGRNSSYFYNMPKEEFEYIKSLDENLVVAYNKYVEEHNNIKVLLMDKYYENEVLLRENAKLVGVFNREYANTIILPLFKITTNLSWKAFKRRKLLWNQYQESANAVINPL